MGHWPTRKHSGIRNPSDLPCSVQQCGVDEHFGFLRLDAENDEVIQLQTVLHEHFEAVTKRVIAQAIGSEDGDVELREGQALEA